MSGHCCSDEPLLKDSGLSTRQVSLLKTVLVIHLLTWIATLGAGLFSQSTAVLADSTDMLGHIILVSFSLFAAKHRRLWIARVSLIKGTTLGAISMGLLWEAWQKQSGSTIPSAHTMGFIGILAVSANVFTVLTLSNHRHGDLNLRSTWLCARNDILTHLSVVLGSILITFTHSRWPDTVLAIILAAMILHSAVHIIRHALALLFSDEMTNSSGRTTPSRRVGALLGIARQANNRF